MFDEMRRGDRRLSNLETESILSAGEYGVLSTVGEDGYPYGVPVNYIYRNGRIYFHCAALQGKKLKNIQFSDKVCFTVVTQAEVLPREPVSYTHLDVYKRQPIIRGFAPTEASRRSTSGRCAKQSAAVRQITRLLRLSLIHI